MAVSNVRPKTNRGLRITRFVLYLSLLSLFVSQSLPASKAAPVDGLTIETKIRKAKIFKEDRPISVAVGADEINVSTSSPTEEAVKDKKINAVLIAKAAMSSDPKYIVKVLVRFYDNGSPKSWNDIKITVGDLKAFGAGALTIDQLLNSLELVPGNAAAPVTSVSTAPKHSYSKKNPEEFQRLTASLCLNASLYTLARKLLKQEADGSSTVEQWNSACAAVTAINNADFEAAHKYISLMENTPVITPKQRKPSNIRHNWSALIEQTRTYLQTTLGEETPNLDGNFLSRKIYIASFIKAFPAASRFAGLKIGLRDVEEAERASASSKQIESMLEELDRKSARLSETVWSQKGGRSNWHRR